MDNGEGKLGKEEGPAGLSTSEFLFCTKVSKVVIIGPNFKGFGVAFEVMSEGFKGTNNSKKFLVVNVVVAFGGLKEFRVVCDRVPMV